MKKGEGIFWFLLNLVFGLYFINFAFNFVTLPEVINNINKWIILVGGVLIIIGGVNALRVKEKF